MCTHVHITIFYKTLEMKKILPAILFVFASFFSIAQKGAILKSYAYQQETAPGMQMENAEPKMRMSYFIYLEILKWIDVDVKYIWVEKKCSKPRAITVSKLPVVIQNNEGITNNDASETLVPKTKNTVLQIMQTDDVDDKKLTKGRNLAAKNAFVIAYIYKGKWYYYTGKKLKELQKQFAM
jgi:hypothetical protein